MEREGLSFLGGPAGGPKSSALSRSGGRALAWGLGGPAGHTELS